eukprot:5664424-Heterocapsa_arctica.AAC.1
MADMPKAPTGPPGRNAASGGPSPSPKGLPAAKPIPYKAVPLNIPPPKATSGSTSSNHDPATAKASAATPMSSATVGNAP